MIKGNVKPVELEDVKNHHPAGKDPHISVSHKDLYLAVTKCAKKNKWSVDAAEVGLSKDELMCALSVQFTGKDLPELGNKLQYSFGVFNSNSRHYAIRFFTGVATSNYGIVMDEVPVTKRHSINTQVGDVILEAMEVGQILLEDYHNQIEQLKEDTLNRKEAEYLLLQAGRLRLMPWSRIGSIDRMFFDTSEKNWTRFRLLACFGRQVRMNPPRFQLQQMFSFKAEVCEFSHT